MSKQVPFDRPFTLAEARASGHTRATVRSWLEHHEIRRVARGLFTPSHLTEVDAVRATRAIADGRLATSYVGAAQLHRLLLPPEPHPSMKSAMRLSRVPPDHLYRSEQVLLAGPAWTAVSLARFQALPAALVPLDSALRVGVSRKALLASARHMAGWPGAAGLETAIGHANALSESALESLARGQFTLAALPAPTLQAEVVANRRRYRLDFLWADARLVLEVDGLVKYDEARVMQEEKRRHNDLQAAGYTVLRCGFVNLYPKSDVLVGQLRRLLSA